MPVHELEFEAKAYEDLEEITEYLAEHSLNALKKFRNKLDKQLNFVRTWLHAGSSPRDMKLRSKGYRFIILDNYLLFYIIENRKVVVKRILHQKRNYFAIL